MTEQQLEVCQCGHTAHWHGQEIGEPEASGQCEFSAECSCKRFTPELVVNRAEVLKLVEAVRDFLEFSQRIERSGDAGAMEEYEAAWHELAERLVAFEEASER